MPRRNFLQAVGYVLYSLGGKSHHHHHHHAGHFFSTKLPATCKKIASSESIKLVRGYSTARNDPWNVESLLSKDKESKKTLSCVVVVVVVQFFVYNVLRE